uniref:ARF GTPase-activating protein GIT1 C-terminal domain-containing protein n=1 Tax=Panagrolaimus superbus TaxID=310955 RepID=A0A914Z0Y2_9BILA
MRQKLAKLDNHGFSLLIIEILKEAKRRHFGLPLPPEDLNQSFGKGLLDSSALSLGLATSPDEENRDYDEVADYMNRKSSTSQGTKRSSGARGVTSENEEHFTPSKKQNGSPTVSWDDYLELKENLQEALNRLTLVTQSSTELIKSQRILQRNVEQLKDQNDDLKREMKNIQQQTLLLNKRNPSPTGLLLSPSSRDPPQIGAILHLPRPARSLNTGDSSADEMSSVGGANVQRSISNATPSQITAAAFARYGRRHGSLSSASGSAFQPLRNGGYPASRPPAAIDRTRNGSAPPSEIPIRDGITSDSNQTINSTSGLRGMFNEDIFPDNLIIETELLTGAIKALLSDLQQDGVNANAAFHSDSINHHIQRIIRVIPVSHRIGNVEECVRKMKNSMQLLSQKCRSRPLQSADDTCHAAYDVAKAAKQLLVNVHQFDA